MSELPVSLHLQGLMVFCLAMFVTLTMVPALIRYSGVLGLMDVPKDARRMHAQAIPRSGGLAMAAGFLVPLLLWLPTDTIPGFVMAVGVIVAFGVLDDRFDLHYRWKFVGQIAAVLLLMWGGVVLHRMPMLGLEQAPVWLSYPLTFVFILGAINSVNLSDGLDGLAAGTSLLSLCILLVVALAAGLSGEAMIAVALMGAIMGFLRYNTHPAQIFMGDTGSQFLGVSLVSLAVVISQSDVAPVTPALPLLVLGLPILDTAMVMFIRIRQKRSPFSPDKNHIHHQLMALGLQHYEVVAVIYVLQILLVSGAYLLRFEPDVLVLSFYLFFCAAILLFLSRARSTGWRLRRVSAGEVSFERRNLLLRRFSWGFHYAHRVLFVALGVCWVGVLALVPMKAESNWLVQFGGLIFALAVIAYRRVPMVSARLAAYGLCAVVVYLASTFGSDELTGFLDRWLVGLAVMLLVSIRFTRREAFGLTTQDILVLFILVVVPFVSIGGGLDNSLGYMALRFAVMVYVVELFLSRGGRGPLWLICVTGGALGVAVMRGFI